ncbi:MAG: DMT family transporter [Actinomycetota bacterium]|nr:DMT family transporter [Actinomycetota bacterium]
MTRSYVPLLLLLSAIWGSSYMFIKVGVRDFSPAAMVEVRLLLAAFVLVGFVAARRGLASIGPALRPGAVVGVVGMAVPFFLISWGETHVDSGVAAVANSSVPIFVALLALWFAPSERSSGVRLVGLAVGLAGVAVVVGLHPGGGVWAVLGALAVVLASLCYAGSSLFIQRSLHVGGPELAAAATVCGALAMLPFAAVDVPDDVGWKPLVSVIVLGVVATGFAQLLVNRLIALHGSARTMLVNYVLPGFALVYGVTLLGEPLTAAKLGGLALILAGVTLASGLLRRDVLLRRVLLTVYDRPNR